jgi:maltodextrin utilization protein YvdJ
MAISKVSAESIRNLSKKIGNLKTKLDPVIGQLDGLSITPGEFTDGRKLKTTAEARAKTVSAYFKSLQTELEEKEKKLYKTADDYVVTDETNDDVAKTVKPV